MEDFHLVNEAYKHFKPIAASGQGVDFLRECRLAGINLPDTDSEEVTTEKGVVTGNPEKLDSFAKSFIEAIAHHRHWDRESTEKVPG